ncbi:hypothetical protein NE237_020076 [Protea cynaroides]|uniref:Uncharacterized protein n=1 Tax=Protea cynaroides TaxID=273540 RepID=A0A9Q0K1Z3_9MAGN|nr:hypothetical protein NE237_020076 [Protea cynaroides]
MFSKEPGFMQELRLPRSGSIAVSGSDQGLLVLPASLMGVPSGGSRLDGTVVQGVAVIGDGRATKSSPAVLPPAKGRISAGPPPNVLAGGQTESRPLDLRQEPPAAGDDLDPMEDIRVCR